MSSKFPEQVHFQPYSAKNGFGTTVEWLELHTYGS